MLTTSIIILVLFLCAFGGFVIYDLATARRRKEVYRIKYEKVQETTDVVKMFEISNIKDYPSVWNRIYTKDLLDRINLRFVLGRFYEDRGFAIRALNNCKKFVAIPEGLYYYVVNPNSIVRSSLSEKKKADKLFSRRDGVK